MKRHETTQPEHAKVAQHWPTSAHLEGYRYGDIVTDLGNVKGV